MSDALFDILRKVTTATITTMLLRKGIRRCWMNGQAACADGERIVGRAFTLRFVPVREDLATWKAGAIRYRLGRPSRKCRQAPSSWPMRWASRARHFGDILCARMKKRNVAALVTDGVVRDRAGVLISALPVWCAGVAAPASVNGLTFVGWQQPIGCGGCAIFPDDVIVADDDGAVVIPQAMSNSSRRKAPSTSFTKAGCSARSKRREAARPLPAERGGQGALRGVAKIAIVTGDGRAAGGSVADVLSCLQNSRLLRRAVECVDCDRTARPHFTVDALHAPRKLAHRDQPRADRACRPIAPRQCTDTATGAAFSALGLLARATRRHRRLGGAISPDVSAARGSVALNEAAERITAAAELARRYPNARIIFPAAARAALRRRYRSEYAVRQLEALGVAHDRITAEEQSRNTIENAGLFAPASPIQSRASAGFWSRPPPHATGDGGVSGGHFSVEAYPVDWRTSGPIDASRPFSSLSDGLGRTDRPSTNGSASWPIGCRQDNELFPGP